MGDVGTSTGPQNQPARPSTVALGLAIADESVEPLPKTHQISQQLRQAIREHHLPIGAKLPTARQLATDLGVNYRTVHQALTTLVQEGWLVRYRRRGTFVKGLPQTTVTALTGIVCPTSIFEDGAPANQRSFITLYEKELQRRGLPHRFYMVNDGQAHLNVMHDDLLADVKLGRVKVLIFPDCMKLGPLAEQLDRAGAAVVAYSSFADVRHRVSVDVEQFIHDAARQMVAQGHRRLGYVFSLVGSSSPPRSVVKAIIEKVGGIAVDRALVGRPSSSQGGHAAAQVIDWQTIDGLIVPDDFMAIGVDDWLAEQPVVTPASLAIAVMWTRENALAYRWPMWRFERGMSLAVHDVAEMVESLIADRPVRQPRRAHQAAATPPTG